MPTAPGQPVVAHSTRIVAHSLGTPPELGTFPVGLLIARRRVTIPPSNTDMGRRAAHRRRTAVGMRPLIRQLYTRTR